MRYLSSGSLTVACTGKCWEQSTLYHNSTENLDYFETESPHGSSTFGVSFLEGAGNLFQLITLTISSQVQQRYAGSGSLGTNPDTYAPTAVPTAAVPQATISSPQTETGQTAGQNSNTNSGFPNAVPAPPAPTAVSTVRWNHRLAIRYSHRTHIPRGGSGDRSCGAALCAAARTQV